MMDLPELEAWFGEGPKWIQDAARRLVQSGALTSQDLQQLNAICVMEAMGQPVTFTGLPPGALAVQDTTKPLRLGSVGDVKGINALSPGRPLEFGEAQLCIVYGRNGAGKSGYVRLLKHVCGARHPGDLLDNIFLSGAQSQSAKLTFSDDMGTKDVHWTGKAIPELQGVEVYDTACGLVYVNEENEVAFEPWLLRMFAQLTKTCTALGQCIQAKIAALVSKIPAIPAEYAATSIASWCANITGSTSPQEVDEKTAWTSEDETALTETNRRLAETNPTGRAAALRRQKTAVSDLKDCLKAPLEALDSEHCASYVQAKTDAKSKRKIADDDAKKVFENAPLAGVGSETWRLLWEAARRYSQEHAYKAIPFPNVAADARCVLCQQQLDEESRERFVSFEEYVKGELERLASDAEQNARTMAALFSEIVTSEALGIRMDAAGIVEDALRARVTDFASVLVRRRQTCLEAEDAATISASPSCDVLAELGPIAAEFERQAAACDEDARGQNRPALELKAKELAARKWLNQQRKAIGDEIGGLQAVTVLEGADRLTNTLALSKRKSILTEELITDAYIKRFRDELKSFNASSLAVEVKKTRTEVGRVYHRISLRKATKDVKTSDVLSEGEFRIVSLAAFVADTAGRGGKTPFLFDDPISSLDHVYEEAAARRLVELCQSRQVIVFTHRLSLVGLLEKYTEKNKVKTSLVCLSRYVTGDVTELPIDLKKTDKAAHFLANERLAAIKKAFADGDAAYEKEAKAICRDIRVLLERVVEVDLLNGIVRRFSQEVNTKGKIDALARIEEEDCKFIDNLMTKYSAYEHSQPEEVPVECPKPNEIESDLRSLSDFIAKVRKRNS